MGDKLGPLLFQFGYFNKTAFKSGKEFLARLEPFLKKLPKGYRFALEIRNKQWLTAEFFDLLRAHKVAYALIDQAWMPRVSEIFEKFDPIDPDFTYIRLLGDRKGIEQQTKTWDKVIVDRSQKINELGKCLSAHGSAGVSTYVYVNKSTMQGLRRPRLNSFRSCEGGYSLGKRGAVSFPQRVVAYDTGVTTTSPKFDTVIKY